MENAPGASDIPETSGLRVGATLRAAREAQGLTVADVAERTKFSVRQVEALEADDKAHLPEGTFLRGFVRSYARVLHLDETALLGAVPAHAAQGLEIADVQSGGVRFPAAESTAQKNIYLLAGALVVALLLAVFVWTPRESPAPEVTVVEPIKLPEFEVVSAPLAASSVVEVLPVAPPPAVAPIQAEPAKPAVASESRKAVPVTPAPTAPAVVPKKAEPAKTVTPESRKTAVTAPVPPVTTALPAKPDAALEQLKKRPIHIVFSEEAWMEIVDTNGEVLLSRMNPAGSEKWIGGGRRAPYKVSIGKAAAVRIYYRGREIDLSKYKQTGLVQLVLE